MTVAPAALPASPPAGADRTRLVPGAPPAARPAPASAPPPASVVESRAGGATQAAEPPHDATVLLARGGGAPSATSDASRTVGVSEEAQDATVLIPSAASAEGAKLERVHPRDPVETLELSKSAYVLGRSRSCDIRLVTATASREHARLSRQGGRWVIEPLQHKTVIAGGVRITRGTVQLTHRMRLKLGEDEFLFLDESAPPSASEGRQTWWGRVLAFFRSWAPKAGG